MVNLIEELRKLDNLKAKYFAQKSAVEELIKSDQLPELKEKYEGKFFCERNSYGAFVEEPDWNVYVYVKKVTTLTHCEAIAFQSNPRGQLELEVDGFRPLSMCKNEITKEVFVEAANQFKGGIDKVLNCCAPKS